MKSPEYVEYLFGKDFPEKIPALNPFLKKVNDFFKQLEYADLAQEKNILREILELERKIKKTYSGTKRFSSYRETIENNQEITPTPFLKDEVIKDILKCHPPVNTNLLINTKKINFKISARTKLSITRFTENFEWKIKYFEILKKTTRSDYINRLPQCVVLEKNIIHPTLMKAFYSKPWGLSHCKETGEIIIFDRNLQNETTPNLLSLLVFLHYLYEVHYFSLSLNLKNKEVGKQILKIFEGREIYYDFLVDGNAHDETIYWHKAIQYLSILIPNQNWNIIHSALNKVVLTNNMYASIHFIDILWEINNITHPTNTNNYHLKQEIWLSLEKYLSDMDQDIFVAHVLNSLHLNNKDFLHSVLAHK